MSMDIEQATVERMVAFFQGYATVERSYIAVYDRNDAEYKAFKKAADTRLKEARAIAALLPPPVDPDLVTAREIAAAVSNSYYASRCIAHGYESGQYDASEGVALALAALRKARAEGVK